MKFVVEICPERNPDAVGEYLRSEFFPTDPKDPWSVGCYSVFDWAPEVEELPKEPVCTEDDNVSAEVFEDLQWTRGRKKFGGEYIECRYYWDGDGTLAFGFPDGSWLYNSDCKKDHYWEYHEECPF